MYIIVRDVNVSLLTHFVISYDFLCKQPDVIYVKPMCP